MLVVCKNVTGIKVAHDGAAGVVFYELTNITVKAVMGDRPIIDGCFVPVSSFEDWGDDGCFPDFCRSPLYLMTPGTREW